MGDLARHANAIASHRQWLDAHGRDCRRKWEDMLAADGEAAVVEARTRELLGGHVDTVEAADVPGSGGPDFRCLHDKGHFYVEATCIRQGRGAQGESVPAGSFSEGPVPSVAKMVLNECRNKAPQLADLGAPALLAVGTWDFRTSCLMTDKETIADMVRSERTWRYYGLRDELIGPFTDGRHAAFQRPGRSPESARQSISGVLLCPFGVDASQFIVRGALHPRPARPFDRRLLPGIEFCQLEQGTAPDESVTEWV